jgi:hypothetical protein
MGIRQHAAVLLALLVPAAAGAHEHNRAFFVGPSGRTGSMLWGVHGSYEEVLFKHAHQDKECRPRHWSLVVDASAHFRAYDEYAITVGPRYTFMGSDCSGKTKYPKPTVSAYLLPVGFQKAGGTADDSLRLAGLLGIQVDVLLRRQDGIRVQADLIRDWSGEKARHFRFSAGLVLRFFDHDH